jgi:hypothetical protein
VAEWKVFLKNSAPGDICWLRQGAATYFSTTKTARSIPPHRRLSKDTIGDRWIFMKHGVVKTTRRDSPLTYTLHLSAGFVALNHPRIYQETPAHFFQLKGFVWSLPPTTLWGYELYVLVVGLILWRPVYHIHKYIYRPDLFSFLGFLCVPLLSYTTTPTRIIQREIGATKWPIAKLQTQRFPRTVVRISSSKCSSQNKKIFQKCYVYIFSILYRASVSLGVIRGS